MAEKKPETGGSGKEAYFIWACGVIREAVDNGLYGNINISMQNGVIGNIKTETVAKPPFQTPAVKAQA